MRALIFIIFIISIISCKQTPETKKESVQAENASTISKTYPKNISKIFKAHGGLNKWNTMNTLKFTMPKETGNEVTTTHLKNRKSLIEMLNHTIGFDGKNVWLKNKDTAQYKGNAKFYYNLMFYFYAMPFILADDGIVYKEAAPLVFEGKSYPGIKISYNAGIGESPEDEYILYYDAETNKMAWLGYTVTYFSKEKSKEFHFIKYSNWQTVKGVLLPETLTWYNYKNNLPTTKRNDVKFTNVILSKEKPSSTTFKMAEGAKIIE